MKINVELIVARLNGKVIFAEALNDCYTPVQVILNKIDLDEVTINELKSNTYVYEYENSFNLGENEAKDIVDINSYNSLKIRIETKEIELEDL